MDNTTPDYLTSNTRWTLSEEDMAKAKPRQLTEEEEDLINSLRLIHFGTMILNEEFELYPQDWKGHYGSAK